jgi:hypothetical protein
MLEDVDVDVDVVGDVEDVTAAAAKNKEATGGSITCTV